METAVLRAAGDRLEEMVEPLGEVRELVSRGLIVHVHLVAALSCLWFSMSHWAVLGIIAHFRNCGCVLMAFMCL